jgi:UDP-N-acetylmuramate--alanine ligase
MVAPMTSDVDADRALKRAHAALGRPLSPFRELPPRLLVVDVPRQRLDLIENGAMVAELEVSTAARGVGGEAGSLRTPPGWHRIHARIGAEQPLGTVFESREPTGEVWRGEPREDDLILTRVLTLEGLEPGINQGPGHDSLERYIYLHGTNHEDQLGAPASHGCVRLSNPDVAWLFDQVEVGDPVVVLGEGDRPGFPDPLGAGRFHFAGIAGSGMGALAQYQAMAGGRVSGSDRAFDRGERDDLRAHLERLGIVLHPQDGSGVEGDCAALVLSTAVESEVPDYARARARGVPTVHRSELLAHFVGASRTAAIAGTSGKSTVVGMTFAILRAAGWRPSLITGGELVELQRHDLVGNAFHDPGSTLLVIEADESDGSLVNYEPAVGVVLNLQKDHKETSEVAGLFARFRERCREGFVASDGEDLAALAQGASEVFGFSARATVRGEAVELGPTGSRFTVGKERFALPVPGRHNVANALAAIAVCRTLGVDPTAMVGPLAEFAGVARRFQSLGIARGVEVVDDFAHNPAKLRAAIETARARARRVLAVYQPHGFGPTRFLRPDLVEAFADSLGPEDRLWMLEVFYAGGTARRDFSAAEIADELAGRGVKAAFATREDLPARIAAEAREGDLVLVMGARDPSLTDLARTVLEALGSGASAGIPGR